MAQVLDLNCAFVTELVLGIAGSSLLSLISISLYLSYLSCLTYEKKS